MSTVLGVALAITIIPPIVALIMVGLDSLGSTKPNDEIIKWATRIFFISPAHPLVILLISSQMCESFKETYKCFWGIFVGRLDKDGQWSGC